MSSAVLDRLESVASKLEAYVAQLSSGNVPAASSSSSSSSSSVASAEVAAFDEFYAASVQPFIDAVKRTPETSKLAETTETAFKHIRLTIEATKSSKKPSDADLVKFLDPVVKIMTAAGEPDLKSPVFNQLKAFSEAVNSLGWVTCSPPNLPRPMVKDQLDAADFYLIKVLTAAKAAEGEKKEALNAFATTLKALMQNMEKLVGEHFKTGLEWNPRGGNLLDYKGSGAAPAAPASSSVAPPPPGPPAPPCPPSAPAAPSSGPAPVSTAAGMGAVFAQLTTSNVTSGLKKVTSDMKTKNMKDVPVLEAKKPAAPAPVAAPKAVAEKKEPKMEERKGTWFVEYFENTTVQLPADLELKQSVYILKCKNVSIVVPNKCKSIQVDNCTKTNVEFKSVVSLVEVFNSQRVKIECLEQFPSIAIDKSAECAIILSREGVANPPTIVTSSIVELNVVVPGKTDEDDPIEIPVPQQFQTTLGANNSLHTEPVVHGSN